MTKTQTKRQEVKIYRAQFPGKVQGIFPRRQYYGLKFTSPLASIAGGLEGMPDVKREM